MEWIDLPFDADGPNGRYCLVGDMMRAYLFGTDHPDEWRLHYPDRGRRIKTDIGWINAGYLDHAMQVYYWLRHTYPGVRSVWIGGHSFGGAIAQILAAMMHGHGKDVRVTTFGTIRAGRIKRHKLPDCTHYIHRWDLAYLWPLWPFYSLHGDRVRFGRWGWPWVVHQPDHYQAYKRLTGFIIR
jgi:hypothetical protein